MVVRSLLCAGLASLGLAAAALGDVPAVVHCGQVITRDTTVANDLTGCHRYGLIIGADDITLDLNGHTIGGDGTFTADCPRREPCDTGIVNAALKHGLPDNGHGHDGVTITNGVISGFPGVGMYLYGVAHNYVRNIEVDGGQDGILFRSSSDGSVEDTTVRDVQFVGVVVSHSTAIAATRNTIAASGFAGYVVEASDHVLLADNVVTSGPDADGVDFFNGSNHVFVTHNDISASGGGIGLNDSDRNVISENTIHDTLFDGLYENGSDDNQLIGNEITGVKDAGAVGIHLDTGDRSSHTSSGNLVVANVVTSNAGDGIRIEAGEPRNVLRGNLASSNGDDGMEVDNPLTTLADNRANFNGDFGIEAVAGVTDAGGNRAAGNGNPLQCANVFCG